MFNYDYEKYIFMDSIRNILSLLASNGQLWVKVSRYTLAYAYLRPVKLISFPIVLSVFILTLFSIGNCQLLHINVKDELL